MHPLSALESPASFVLSAPGGEAPPLLESVDIDAQVDGVLFTLALRQSWRHTGSRPLEVLYTFPLPPQGLLLSFSVTRGEERLDGTILPRAQAEDRYERALARGDAPALLEVGPNGLHTASIGNLEPGETAVLEVRFTQLLRFEHGRLRLVVPTTVAPRYGQPGAAGLAPHQAPATSITAEYPLSLSLTIAGSLASARLECPTHRHHVSRGPGTTRLALEPGARMDRDVVVLLQPVEPRPGLLVSAADGLSPQPRQVSLAAFELPRRPAHRPLSLKLLVDCSGSMAGDSIASAQAALRAIADRLGADDEVALVHFGSAVKTALLPARCTAATLHALRLQIDATQAAMGGTEMEAALQTTLALPHGQEQADILLITDGQVWQSQAVADSARRSGQRVFAIGVGSAPAEGALREIAAASGGACDFATPGEDLQAAAMRMIERMRDTPWHDLTVDWGREPLWQAPVTGHAFGGDTVIAMAVFEGSSPLTDVALASADQRIPCTASEACDAEVLARMVADRERLHQGAAEATTTAVRYRLLTEHTHCVLVHQRAEGQRTSAPAELMRLPSMLAAGWGGIGTAVPRMARFSLPEAVLGGTYGAPPAMVTAVSACLMSAPLDASFSELPSSEMLRSQAGTRDQDRATRSATLVGLLPAGEVREALRFWAAGLALPDAWARLLGTLGDLGLTGNDAWIVIVYWAQVSSGGTPALPAWAQDRLDALHPGRVKAAGRLIDAAVGSQIRLGWSQRAQRLAGALRR